MSRTGNVQEEARKLIWSVNLKATSIMFIATSTQGSGWRARCAGMHQSVQVCQSNVAEEQFKTTTNGECGL